MAWALKVLQVCPAPGQVHRATFLARNISVRHGTSAPAASRGATGNDGGDNGDISNF
jgi:hypothetical protein